MESVATVLVLCFTAIIQYEVIALDLPLPPLPPNPEQQAAFEQRQKQEPWLVSLPPNQAPYPLFDPNLSPWGNFDQIPSMPLEALSGGSDWNKGLPNGNGFYFMDKKIDNGFNGYFPYRNFVKPPSFSGRRR